MVRTIIEGCLDIYYWVTSDNTTSQCVFHTFLNWFAVFLRNDTTFDLVDEFEAFAWFVWLKLNPNITILTTTTRLFDLRCGRIAAGL